MSTIREAVKIMNGKPIYVVQVSQGEDNKDRMQIYIKNGDVYFESGGYGWNDNSVYSVSDEAHALAKEMFLSSLQVAIKNRILELKQLESILDDIGLINVIRPTLDEIAPRLNVGQRIAKAIKGE